MNAAASSWNVLLNVEVVIDDRGVLLPQCWELVDGFVHEVVVHVVGGGLGPWQKMIGDLLFDKAMAIGTADDRIEWIEVFELGLQFSAILWGDFSAKDNGDLVGLFDGAVRVQESLAQGIAGNVAVKMRLLQYST